MPYVAPMPNPDLVTGPDWTQLLGSVAVGLTKGVGEGAEIIRQDRAQKMQQQRDAAEQAYRDRHLEAEKARWDADAAYRNDRFKFEKGQAQNQMELNAYNAYTNAETHAGQLAETKERTKNIALNTQSLVDQRDEALRIKKLTERGATLHGQGGDRDTFIQRKTDELMNAYGISPEDMVASDEARQFINAKIQSDLEAFDYYTGTVKGVPDKDASSTDKGSKRGYDPNNVMVEEDFDDAVGVNKNLIKTMNAADKENPYRWTDTKTGASGPRKLRSQMEDTLNGTNLQRPSAPRNSISTVPPPVPPQAMGEERPPKTLPVDALAGLDQPTQKLVLRASAGDTVAYADLKRNRPGLVEQIMQKRKSK